jgi:hypothetical protein
MDMLDEFCDVDGTGVVTLCHAVASKTCLSGMLEYSHIERGCVDLPARRSKRSMIEGTPRWSDGRHLCP